MNFQHLRLKWHFEKLDKYGQVCIYIQNTFLLSPLIGSLGCCFIIIFNHYAWIVFYIMLLMAAGLN